MNCLSRIRERLYSLILDKIKAMRFYLFTPLPLYLEPYN